MIESNYNFEFRLQDGTMLIYNAFTNALVNLQEDQYQDWKRAKQDKNYEELPKLKEWQYGGFLVNKVEDELKSLRLKLWSSRCATNRLSMTIAPTLGCNFRCIYCYEQTTDSSKKMDQKVQDAIVIALEQKLAQIESFHVSWYGGEPLLAMDVIRSLSKRFMLACDENNVVYSPSIVTNGYLLTPEIATELKEMRIESCQITLDGPPEIHDTRRPLAGGAPSFTKILENISACADILNISLRINIDRTNVQSNDELLDILKKYKLQDRINVYVGWVEAQNSCYNSSTCLSRTEFSEEKIKFAHKLKDYNFKVNALQEYPSLKKNYCGADSYGSLVVAPNGDVVQCWGDVGIQDYTITSLVDNTKVGNSDRYYDYMLYDPTLDLDCVSCKYLPICMGGCPKRRIDKDVDRCTHIKNNIEKYISYTAALIFEERKNRPQAEAKSTES